MRAERLVWWQWTNDTADEVSMTAPKTPTQLHTEPLTPAQVEALKAMAQDREEALLLKVQQMIADAITTALTPVEAAVAEAIKWGDSLALRAAQGQVLCADEGGPSVPNQPITFSSREGVAAHESFKTERGQG
jgi:hypothetical protein